MFSSFSSVQNYRGTLEAELEKPKWKDLLPNKRIQQVILDKVGFIVGKWNKAEMEEFERHGYSAQHIALKLMIEAVEESHSDLEHELDAASLKRVDLFLDSLKELRERSHVFDSVRLQRLPCAIEVLERGNLSTLNFIEEDAVTQSEYKKLTKQLAKEYVTIFQQWLKDPNKKYFNIYGGDFFHETQVVFKKNEDGTVTLIHLDTGQGTSEALENCDPAEFLNNYFWKRLFAKKFAPAFTIGSFNALLPPTVQEKEAKLLCAAKRKAQESPSCGFQSLLSLALFFFVDSADNTDIARLNYKHFKAIVSKKIMEMDGPAAATPHIRQLAEEKVFIRTRHIFFQEAVKQGNQEILDHFKSFLQKDGDFSFTVDTLERLYHEGVRVAAGSALSLNELEALSREENIPMAIRLVYMKVYHIKLTQERISDVLLKRINRDASLGAHVLKAPSFWDAFIQMPLEPYVLDAYIDFLADKETLRKGGLGIEEITFSLEKCILENRLGDFERIYDTAPYFISGEIWKSARLQEASRSVTDAEFLKKYFPPRKKQDDCIIS